MNNPFTILNNDAASKARCGSLELAHGTVQTPIFMPVGTQATVKSLTPSQINDCGAQIILGNTYHLNLRPTSQLIKQMGGLHSFMNWNKPILTDSGGFQVFSLSKLRKLTKEGVKFKSHIDGAEIFLTPSSCIEIQDNLNSDIAMVLDVCPPFPCSKKEAIEAINHTIDWAKLCLEETKMRKFEENKKLIFAICQGGVYEDLRKMCASEISQMPFPGFAIGGVSVGEPEEEMIKQVSYCTAILPKEKPRYVMGVGTPVQLLKMIALGADMFDCVMPTRLARHGCAFTNEGTINLKNARFAYDKEPLCKDLQNYTSSFSRSYLRHLVVAKEMLACTLLSIHNTHFFLDLMKQARFHIANGDYISWSNDWIERYNFVKK